jgi:hypothetical protein
MQIYSIDDVTCIPCYEIASHVAHLEYAQWPEI